MITIPENAKAKLEYKKKAQSYNFIVGNKKIPLRFVRYTFQEEPRNIGKIRLPFQKGLSQN